MQVSRKVRQIAIALVDILILSLSAYLAYLIRSFNRPSLPVFFYHCEAFLPVIAAWLVCLYTAGMYSLENPYAGYKTIGRIFIIACICTVVGFAFYYLRREADITPKTMLVLFSFFGFVLISLWRWVFYKLTIRYFKKPNITFIGINNTVGDLLKNTNNFSYMSYNVPFLFDDTFEGEFFYNIPVIKDDASFIEGIKKNKIKVIVLASEGNVSHILQGLLFELLRCRVYFFNISNFYEYYLRRIPLEAVNEVWFLRNFNLSVKNLYQSCKRPLDVVMAVLLLLVTSPFWPLLILLIRLGSRGPAFFTQTRIGYLGREFTLFKFRTMRSEGDTATLKAASVNDSRITKFGQFLRKTRVDEIPQMLNVLKGDMSFIGPRPERPELIAELEQVVPFYRQRLFVKPGLSGWDQVSGEYHSSSKEDTYKKLQNDLYYIKNMSLFLDVSIFAKTLVTVCSRSGV